MDPPTVVENADRPLVPTASVFSRRAKLGSALVLSLAVVAAVAVVAISLTRPDAAPEFVPQRNSVDNAKVLVVDDEQASGENWLPSTPGTGPFLTKWYGSAASQSFHHDGAKNKGTVRAKWSPNFKSAGCYEVFEWHAVPSAGFSSANMPRSVPFWIIHRDGETKLSVDQSVHGGEWNSLGAFRFDMMPAAHFVRSSNEGTDNCEAKGQCYWIADALKFSKVDDSRCVHVVHSRFQPNLASVIDAERRAKADAEHDEPTAVLAEPLPTASPTAATTAAPTAAPTAFKCEKHIVLNDGEEGEVSGENWIKGRVGEKPYFDEWFGDLWTKDFHHDAAQMPKGRVHAHYSPRLERPGCYLVQEWHLGGSRWCFNYMPKSVPIRVRSASGEHLAFVDQSKNGGQWNDVGMYNLDANSGITISNNDTDNCVYRGHCYTVFDSLRLIHLGDACDSVDSKRAQIMADKACNQYGLLQQPMRARVRQNAFARGEEMESAEGSDARLAAIDHPNAADVAHAGQPLTVEWRTEGWSPEHQLRLNLHNGFEHVAMLARAKASDGKATVHVPDNAVLSEISSRPHGNKFFIRMEMAHEQLELNTGFMQDQLVAESPEFVIE